MSSSTARRSLAPIVAAFAALTATAQADTIKVRPGKNAIQKAVNRADTGNRLLVSRGVYREDVTVDKRLRIVGRRGKRRPVLDGGCKSSVTLDIRANGVRLRRLKVKGASGALGGGYTVNFLGVAQGTAEKLTVIESCPGAAPLYGINLYSTGAVQVRGNRTFGGFEDAGIYVGSISDTGAGTLLVAGNESFGNNRGIIIEFIQPAAQVVVRNNHAHDNTIAGFAPTPTGIFLHGSDGVRYVDNRVVDNGDYGFHVDGLSDDNVFIDNTARRNPEENFFDEGTGSCGANNSFPLPPC